MKKVMSIAIILVAVFALAIPAFSSAGAVNGRSMVVYCPKGGPLNVWPTPMNEGRSLEKLMNGTVVEMMNDYGNGWALVRTGRTTGYVQTKYLQAGQLGKYQATENLQNFVAVNPYTVVAKALNAKTAKSVGLRPVPSKASQEIRRLQAGDQLQVIARGSVWSQVVDLRTGRTGYVANDYVQAI